MKENTVDSFMALYKYVPVALLMMRCVCVFALSICLCVASLASLRLPICLFVHAPPVVSDCCYGCDSVGRVCIREVFGDNKLGSLVSQDVIHLSVLCWIWALLTLHFS